MLGASARYSFLRTPVETLTPPYLGALAFQKVHRSLVPGGGLKSCLDRFGIRNAKGIHRYLLHHLRRSGLIIVVGSDSADLVNRFNALDHLAKCGILAIQMGRILVHNEELYLMQRL